VTPAMRMKMLVEQFRASTSMLSRRFYARAQEKTGELYIYDAIGLFGGVSAQDVADALGHLENAGCNALNVYVNSPGGDVFDGVAIYNRIRRFEGKKSVYIDGLAASAASFIAMAGDKGCIYSAKNATWMIHDAWGFASGNAADLRKAADLLEQVTATVTETYVDRTKRTADEVRQWMASETWMNAKVALERGFCDAILADGDDESEAQAQQRMAFPLVDKFKNTPPALRQGARAASVLIDEVERRIRARAVQPPAQAGK
jgi:ATP-dependent Clp protease protease subunit